jgi:hypothetical protein
MLKVIASVLTQENLGLFLAPATALEMLENSVLITRKLAYILDHLV